jgi:alpha-tubulin suppressor-like RCC1 family protein
MIQVTSMNIGEGSMQKLQLGLGDRKQRNMPCEVPGLAGKICVYGACGKHHTVVITEDGKSLSWGFNGMGQTGTCEVKLWIRVLFSFFYSS